MAGLLNSIWDFLNRRYTERMVKTPADERTLIVLNFKHIDGVISELGITANCSQRVTHQALIICENVMRHRPDPRLDLWTPEMIVTVHTALSLSTSEPMGIPPDHEHEVLHVHG